MTNIKLIIKGSRCNFVITGATFDEVIEEYEKHKKEIEKIIGETISKQKIEMPKERESSSSSNSLQSRVLDLVNDGFFNSPKTASQVREALQQRAYTFWGS